MQAQPTTIPAAGRTTPCNAAPKPRGKGSTSAAYWTARNYATLHIYLTADTLMREMGISRGSAARLLEQLQADGVLGEPDMFGVFALAIDERLNQSREVAS